MFDRLTEELLDLTVVEHGSGGGPSALPAFPLCCSIVLCVQLCSSCSSESRPE